MPSPLQFPKTGSIAAGALREIGESMINFIRRALVAIAILSAVTLFTLDGKLKKGPFLRVNSGPISEIDFHGEVVRVSSTDHFLYFWSMRTMFACIFAYMLVSAIQVVLKSRSERVR